MVHFNHYMLPDNYDKKVDRKYNAHDLRDHEIERKLGRGYFGTVFLARMRKDNKMVAIKKVPRESGEASVFRDEYRYFKNMLHPNLIQYIGYFESQRYYNFVLEYAPNGTLETKIDERIDCRNYWTENEIAKMTADIVLGLEFLHDHGFIHRDLKPDNIVIDANDHLKITDFGMAKVMHATGHEELYALKIGPKCYGAPELLQRKRYDSSVDYWSLGVILYEMCTLMHPNLKKAHGKMLPRIPNIYSDKFHLVILEMLEVDPDYRCDEESLKTLDIFRVHYDAAIVDFKQYWARKVLNSDTSDDDEDNYY